MGFLDRFKLLALEKKLLILFVGIGIALPFSMARSPLEIAFRSLLLWFSFPGTVSLWFASGKPFWQVFLACYGISSVEMLGIYFGTFGVRLAMNWLKKKLEKGLKLPFGNQFLFLKEKSGYQKLNSFTDSKKKQFIGWLGRQSIWIILLFLFLPIPITSILATVALGTRRLKYGHWYLVAINLPHIFLVVLRLRFLFF